MTANFLWNAGTSNNGLIASALSLLTTELNGLTSTSYATSSVGGTSGVFSNANTGQAMWGVLQFQAGASFTPSGGAYINIWFLESLDGSTFEASSNLNRRPDAVFSMAGTSIASSGIILAQGRLSRLPSTKFKVLAYNGTGVTLPASGNVISVGPIAAQY